MIITVSDFEDVLADDLLPVPAPVNQLMGFIIPKNVIDLASDSLDMRSYVQVSLPCLSLDIILGAPNTLVISVWFAPFVTLD